MANGIHSLSLANLGFRVDAVDFCKTLLKELEERSGIATITTHQMGILTFLNRDINPVDCITWMGDTLCHLTSFEEIEQLFIISFKHLVSKGKFVLSFRDLTNDLQETQRFIPVKSDATRIHTCFLEYYMNMTERIGYKK